MAQEPECNTRPDALWACVQGLIPELRSRAADAERDRRIPQDSVATLRDGGLFRVFQPSRFGGSELPMAEVLPLVSEAARGCPSTAWVLAVLQIHEWILGLFPEQAQDDVFARDPDVLVAGVLQPRAAVTRVDGGYRIAAARWPYGSGCDHGAWALLGGLVQQPQGPPDAILFVLPADDFAIHDDWHVTGLRATGSKSLTTSGAMVPEHRTLRFADAISGAAAEGRNALYRAAFVPMLSLNVTGPALGAARTAIEAFKTQIQDRHLPFSVQPQKQAAQTHLLLAQAMLKVDTAELLLQRGAALVRDASEAKQMLPVTERTRIRAYSSAAVRCCVDAIQSLFLASGGTVLQETHPLQQLNRDAQGMALHAALANDNNLELWGAATLEQPLNTPLV